MTRCFSVKTLLTDFKEGFFYNLSMNKHRRTTYFQGVGEFAVSKRHMSSVLLGQSNDGLFQEAQGFIDVHGFTLELTFRLQHKQQTFD